MARYIDADKAKEFIKEYSEKLSPLSSVCEKSLTVALNAIDLTPTADVVPKSEVERIFEELEQIPKDQPSYVLYVFLTKKIAELKKKYMVKEKEASCSEN